MTRRGRGDQGGQFEYTWGIAASRSALVVSSAHRVTLFTIGAAEPAFIERFSGNTSALNNCTVKELQRYCRQLAVRSKGKRKAELKEALSQWLRRDRGGARSTDNAAAKAVHLQNLDAAPTAHSSSGSRSGDSTKVRGA